MKHPDFTSQCIQSRPREQDTTTFADVYLSSSNPISLPRRSNANDYTLSQAALLSLDSALHNLNSPAQFILVQTFPALSVRYAKISEQSFNFDCITQLNKGTNYTVHMAGHKLKYHHLDEDILHIRIFCDAALENNRNLTFQLGDIVLLLEKYDQCHMLHYNKQEEKTRSPICSWRWTLLFPHCVWFHIHVTPWLPNGARQAHSSPHLHRLQVHVCRFHESYIIGVVASHDRPNLLAKSIWENRNSQCRVSSQATQSRRYSPQIQEVSRPTSDPREPVRSSYQEVGLPLTRFSRLEDSGLSIRLVPGRLKWPSHSTIFSFV